MEACSHHSIESANVTSIDLTKDKARSKNELLTKIREFIESVREKTASDVPDDFLGAAIFILVKDLKAQIAAVNKVVVKEEQREQTLRLHASPKSTRSVRLISRKRKRTNMSFYTIAVTGGDLETSQQPPTNSRCGSWPQVRAENRRAMARQNLSESFVDKGRKSKRREIVCLLLYLRDVTF